MSDLVCFHKSKLDALADKINEKCGGGRALSLDEMINKIDEISSADSDSSLREFLENKETLDYCYSKYKGNNYIKFTINPQVKSMRYCWDNSNLTVWDEICDTSAIKDGTGAFHLSNLKVINGFKTDSMTNAYGLFSITQLEKVSTPLNFQYIESSTALKYCFEKCYKLTYIRFVAATIHWSISFADSPLLSAESVQSIIDGLATVTTAQTITFHKNIALTDAQKQTINEKGWTLVQA